jgi:hypothetical protein
MLNGHKQGARIPNTPNTTTKQRSTMNKKDITHGRFVVVVYTFVSEDDDPDGRHIEESWRLEFYPSSPQNNAFPLENAIFVSYTRNKLITDALENSLLDSNVEEKEDKLVQTMEDLFRTHKLYFFTIKNSAPVASPPPVICYDIMVLREPYSFSAWHSVYKADYSLNAI